MSPQRPQRPSSPARRGPSRPRGRAGNAGRRRHEAVDEPAQRGPAEEIVLAVGAPAHGGHCVARPADDPTGRVVFVRHALPGETVRAAMTEKNAKIWRADAVEILTPSPDRVDSVWPQAGPGGVGGGELAHVALPAQRTWKRWVLADCLRRIGGPATAQAVAALEEAGSSGSIVVEPLASEAAAEASGQAREARLAGTGTRTRVSLTVGPDGRPGMHGFRSGTVQPLDRLPLAVAAIEEIGLLESSRWRKHYRPGMRVEAVAPSIGEPLVLLDDRVLTSQAHATGRRRVEEAVDASGLGLGELRYSLHAEGFWQIHRDAPVTLVDRVVRAALGQEPSAAGTGGDGAKALGGARGKRVMELYSGAGLFTLPLAMLIDGGELCAIEGSSQAVGDARRNLHGLGSVRLSTGRVTARSVTQAGQAMGGAPDVVVLDPPRQGAGREVIGALAGLAPERIVLVACDPAALARDLAVLLDNRYELAAMSALDMFPHTHHFETIAVLERR